MADQSEESEYRQKPAENTPKTTCFHDDDRAGLSLATDERI
jgi:hypothetical protein